MDFIDQTGSAVAYLDDDGEAIYLWDGTPAAYLDGDSVYAYSGIHLGYFTDGWIRDEGGAAVVFTEAASGGPVRPVRQVRRVRGVRQVRPVRGVRQVRPVRPVQKVAWSAMSSRDFFMQ